MAPRPRFAFHPAGADAIGLEREADGVAERLSNQPAEPIAAASAPRPAAPASSALAPAPVQAALRSPGRPLAEPSRRAFEAGLGQDLGSVRIHDHSAADSAAASLGALAFTFGSDIGFRSGRFAPHTADGKKLLAHELAHVVQQRARGARLQLKENPKAKPAQKGGQDRRRLEVETRLYGLEALFDRYRTLVAQVTLRQQAKSDPVAALASYALDTALGNPLERAAKALDADLRAAGFSGGTREFGAMVARYEKMFERETLALANRALDQYDAQLRQEQLRYGKPGAVTQLYNAVKRIGAEAAYDKGLSLIFSDRGEAEIWLLAAEAKVRKAAAGHPVVQEAGFPRKELAEAEEHEAWALLIDYIKDRRRDVARTRAQIARDPLMIYRLDVLMASSLKAQGVQKGSILHEIVAAKQGRVKWDRALPDILLGIIAIAAGLLSFGTGTIAVLGAGAALGIGAYQAVDAFRDYEIQNAAYGAKLLSDEPSFGWVIVSVVGAGLDAGALVKALKAAPGLRAAITTFNAGDEAGDVAKLGAKLEKIQGLDAKIRAAVVRGANQEVEIRAAWEAMRPPPGVLQMRLPFTALVERIGMAVHVTAYRGIRKFDLWLKSREAIDLIGDVGKLSAKELAAVKRAFLQAVDEMRALAARGKSLGLTDDEMLYFVSLRGKGMQAAEVGAAMDTYKAGRAASPAHAGASGNVRGDTARKAGDAATASKSAYWTKFKEFEKIRVHQRDDLIDPALVKDGKSNLQRMKDGKAPIGSDGESINLHHMLQTADSPVVELTQSFHRYWSRVLHINPSSIPSGINRPAFDAWKARYWRARALDFEQARP